VAWLERSAIVSELSHFVMVNMVAGRGSGLRVAVMNRLGQLFILNALMGFPPATQAHESRPAYPTNRLGQLSIAHGTKVP